MDATITNTGTTAYFIPGPDINLDPGQSKVWSNVSLAELDDDVVLKGYIKASTATVSLADDTTDSAGAVQGSISPAGLQVFTYANLPTGFTGRIAYCSNGRKTGEGPGAGTGVPVYYSAAVWRRFYDDAAVTI